MKKRIFAIVTALMLVFVMLTGCGDTSKDNYHDDRDDYLDDIEGISSLNDADISSDPEEMADDLNDVLKELKLKTPEGKAIKKDLQDMVDILDKMVKNMDDLDEDEAEKMYNDLMEIYDKLEDHVNDFIEAAEDAGVDDNDIADLDIDF